MININHPSYPFPTIQEVICEIHFRIDGDWQSSFYSEYFKKIEEMFPTFEPVAAPLTIRIAQQPEDALGLSVPLIMRYRHNSRNLLLQLSENRLAINVLPKYPGWHQVREDIKYSWNKLCEVVHPLGIQRIGLRYINWIERSTKDETLSRWLQPSAYVPTTLLDAPKGFGAQVLRQLTDKDRILVRVTDQVYPPNNLGTFVFDVDRVTETEIEVDENSLLTNATRLHDDVWDVFKSVKTNDLERLLQGDFL